MKRQESNQHQQIQIVKPLQNKVRRNKAEGSKCSKSSHYTRRRQQPDSSQQYLLPAQIPKTKGSESICTQGSENQLTKAVIRIPYNLLCLQKFSSLNDLNVQNKRIIINVQKQLDYVTVLARSVKQSKLMQVENQINHHQAQDPDNQKLKENDVFEIEDIELSINIWGKYVYLSGFEVQNKLVKKMRKDLSSFQESEIIKFKLKQVNSDMFISLNLRLEEKYTFDYNGLVNQGNTCYMNSYLQTLYHIPAFRNLVYEAKIQEETKFPATLQQLFFKLNCSEKSVSPEMLVKSFGWGKQQTSIQQDAQQFSCLFFEALERKLNDSAPLKGYKNRTIEGLFKGQLNHYLRCTEVGIVIYYTDFRRENYQEFIDLQLPIYPTLAESLDAYTTEVHLEGDNKYSTEEYGFQQAYKGVKIAYFPPVLMIQLKRFQYCFEKGHNVKILAGLEYQQDFDFSPWSITGQKEEYELYAVLVHEGARAESGHYYNFVKVGDLWYKFNDELVQQVSKQKALQYNFGGFHESVQFDAKQMKVQKKLIESKTTAYMLVYVKKQLKKQLMLDQYKLPEWIEKKNYYKLEQEEIKKNKKKFISVLSLIDWQKALLGRDCSEMGFLDQFILESSKVNFQNVPKEANVIEWLAQSHIIQNSFLQKKKKPTKKPSKSINKSEEQKINEQGIYIYYATSQRENLIRLNPNPQYKMEDLLKLLPDPNPILFKAPFAIKKDENLAVIKKYSVDKNRNGIKLNFTYQSLMVIKKDLKYIELFKILEKQFPKKSTVQAENQQNQNHEMKKINFYIDDWKLGPINLSDNTGPIPYPVPAKNHLLVCVFQELSQRLTIQEQEKYDFSKWYQNKKDTINLIVVESKSSSSFQLKDIDVNLSLAQLRKLIFKIVLEQKKSEYESGQNIVLYARLKKGTKVYSQISQPQYSALKELIKIEQRIEFSFSSLTVSSRLSQFIIQFYYRNKKLDYSQPIELVIDRNQESINIVKKIKQHPKILELLQVDGLTLDQAQLIILNKSRLCIYDIVTNQGKAILKGDFSNFLKSNKSSILVVEGRNTLNLQIDSKVQIKQDQDIYVNVLVYQVSHSIQKIGIPRYLKVDRRMQLHELKHKILNLIKDQVYGWEGKIHHFNPSKTRILLYGKDNKKAIQLTDLDSIEQIKKLKIQEKNASLENKRNKIKEIKNLPIKQSMISQLKEVQLQQIKQVPSEEETKTIKKKVKLSNDVEKNQPVQNCQVNNEGQKLEEEQNQEQQLEQVTQLQGPETIYGVFPKVRVLNVQIIHNYLIRPNITLKLNVDG